MFWQRRNFNSKFLKFFQQNQQISQHKNSNNICNLRQLEIFQLIIQSKNLIGKILAFIPLSPRFSKMLLKCRSLDTLGYGILLVSTLSVDEIFKNTQEKLQLSDDDDDDEFNEDDSDEENEITKFKKQINQQQKIKKQKKKLLELKKIETDNFKNFYQEFIMGKSDLFLAMNILGKFIQDMQLKPRSNLNYDTMQQLDHSIYEFAKQYQLQQKSLKEIYQNLQQLLMILDSIIQDKEEKIKLQNFFSEYHKPSLEQQQSLQECLLATFHNKVARKKYLSEEKKIVYECTELNEPVYISSKSCLYKSLPDFVTYTDIIQRKYISSQRSYLHNVTEVSDLQQLYKYDQYKKIEYLSNPVPFFSKKYDRMVVFAKSKFGPKLWELPLFQTEFDQDSIEKYYHFARSLLQGQVFDFFKALQKLYNIDMKQIKISNINPIVTRFVNQLRNHNVDSMKTFQNQLNLKSTFLLEETGALIKNEFKDKLQQKWNVQTICKQ